MGTQHPKNILVAPLDWGLGHTARVVPLIAHILQAGHRPIVAGNVSQLAFIGDTFGSTVSTIPLNGYDIRYSAINKIAQAGLLAQLPRISNTIRTEHKWLQQHVAGMQLHGIISDNRYGLHHSSIPSVIITHQLQVLSGMGSLADSIVRRTHYRYLQRFGHVWVPDVAATPGLAGWLSHPSSLPHNTSYIGLLSRFAGKAQGGIGHGPLVILLSGPEPQRSNLSAILWPQAVAHNGPVVFIEGSETAAAPDCIPAHLTYHKRLAGAALLPVLAAAQAVVCRSGYSTIMDLVALSKHAILIPTPGQTEQEYLARHLSGTHSFYATKQAGFNLAASLSAARAYQSDGHSQAQENFCRYKAVLDDWLQLL